MFAIISLFVAIILYNDSKEKKILIFNSDAVKGNHVQTCKVGKMTDRVVIVGDRSFDFAGEITDMLQPTINTYLCPPHMRWLMPRDALKNARTCR